MLVISEHIVLQEHEIKISAIRSGGPGGQHVNKVSTGIELRFDINASSLPYRIKRKFLKFQDNRISKEGVLVIKSTQYRSQLKNEKEALERLKSIVKIVTKPIKRRIPTKPSKKAVQKRLAEKKKKSERKSLRNKSFNTN